MTTIDYTYRTPTLGQIPLAIGTVLARNARRAARRERFRRLSSFILHPSSFSSQTHTARLDRETIESNLPLR